MSASTVVNKEDDNIGLKLRKKERRLTEAISFIQETDKPKGDRKGFRSLASLILFISIIVVSCNMPVQNHQQGLKSHPPLFGKYVSSEGDQEEILMLEKDVKVTLEFSKVQTDSQNKSLGPHSCTLSILKAICPHPQFQARLMGDALLWIQLLPSTNPMTFTGTFYMPIEGRYWLDIRWYGCSVSDHRDLHRSLSKPVFVTSSSHDAIPAVTTSKIPISIFKSGFWLSKSRFMHEKISELKSDYLWISLDHSKSSLEIETFYNAKSRQGEESTVLRSEGTPISSEFGKLSNYEVVCWVGDASSSLSHRLFLSLRGQIASSQRPFKFHYYPVTDLDHPDKDMSSRRMSRKCKQTFVSLEELEGVSQIEYKKKMQQFLEKIAKCMHDETWSIWMMTVNSNKNSTRMCHSATIKSYNQDHPCNDALFELFDENSLPSNVRLFDNTDISAPQFGENIIDVASTIAMRVFAVIGYQVKTWRAMGQVGRKDGLHRGSKIENDPADTCSFGE
mmetsp:Transcript_21374/g.32296  ORF Transcript_21374/g.32296 Transcript_21374/m.32296 type:complete len:505 (+) Transcript_21374:216-1730(+)